MQNTLTDILSKSLYTIPDYQRSYSWTPREVEDCWNDLVALKHDGHHFMGTVVLYEMDGVVRSADSDHCKEYAIVDGQQRLTTIMLLLRIIRDEFVQANDAATPATVSVSTSQEGMDIDEKKLPEHSRSADKINDLLYIHLEDDEGEELEQREPLRRYRLQLNKDVNEFWISHIMKQTDVAQHDHSTGTRLAAEHKLLEAYKLLQRKVRSSLESLTGRAREKEMKALLTKLKNQLQFTVFKTKDDTSVGIMFETLNNRGRPLSEMDKVKNYLLYTARTNMQIQAEARRLREVVDTINTKWSAVLHEISSFQLEDVDEERHEDQLIRYHRLSIVGSTKGRGAKVQFSRLGEFAKVKQFLSTTETSSLDDLQSVLVKYCSSLAQSAVMYCTLQHPLSPMAYVSVKDAIQRSKLRHWTWKLLKLEVAVAPFCPLLMQAMRICLAPDGDIHDSFLTLLAYAEVFVVLVYKVKRCKTSTGHGKLHEYAASLDDKARGDYQSVLDVVGKIKQLTRKHCKNNVRCSELNTLDSRSLSIPFVTYVLLEYERDLRMQSHAGLMTEHEIKAVEVEHVLPREDQGQQLNAEWCAAFPKKHLRLQYCNSIGNLSLTTRERNNTWYKAHPYTQKRGTETQPVTAPCYLNSTYFIERQFKDFDAWGADECKARRTMLVRWMECRWSDSVEEAQSELAASFDAPPFFDNLHSAHSHWPANGAVETKADEERHQRQPEQNGDDVFSADDVDGEEHEEEDEEEDEEYSRDRPVTTNVRGRTIAERKQKRQRS